MPHGSADRNSFDSEIARYGTTSKSVQWARIGTPRTLNRVSDPRENMRTRFALGVPRRRALVRPDQLCLREDVALHRLLELALRRARQIEARIERVELEEVAVAAGRRRGPVPVV